MGEAGNPNAVFEIGREEPGGDETFCQHSASWGGGHIGQRGTAADSRLFSGYVDGHQKGKNFRQGSADFIGQVFEDFGSAFAQCSLDPFHGFIGVER